MTPPHEIRTPRLHLRQWQPADRGPFADLNADPVVREFFPSLLTREQSDQSADRFEAHIIAHGYGFWAVEIPGSTSFAGFLGICQVPFEAHFCPAVEIGWRLAKPWWGQGYATEGARAVLEFGWNVLQLDEIVAITVPTNVRSRNVMNRIGMTHDSAGDFPHPLIPDGNPFQRHVLYRISRPTATG